jgi:glycosyltransferase involved in cell wall biosynthesis
MRVVQAMAGAAHGGAETYFVDMVTALHRAGLDQTVVIRTNAERAAVLRDAGIEPYELPFGGLLDMVSRSRLARIIAAFQPDIVQSWMNRATRFVPRPAGAERFVHVGWLGGYYKLSNYYACGHLVGVTPDIRAHCVEGGLSDDCAHYIPTFARAETAPAVPREELATPDGAPLFLGMGRLHEKKAFDILIRAIDQVGGAYLWIAGDGPLEGELAGLIAELNVGDRVRLLGWRDDREALFAAADYCVMPSRFEPFGTVMIEAWAHNVPLIAAAAEGPKGLIEDGDTGLLVPIDDSEALARAMKILIADPILRTRLVTAARTAFEARFTEDAVVAQYHDLYENILKS